MRLPGTRHSAYGEWASCVGCGVEGGVGWGCSGGGRSELGRPGIQLVVLTTYVSCLARRCTGAVNTLILRYYEPDPIIKSVALGLVMPWLSTLLCIRLRLCRHSPHSPCDHRHRATSMIHVYSR
jgi:hypothetical protein